MPRDAGGIYFLPAGNPVIPGTVIESDWANPTMSDLGGEVSDSLSRSGKGGMLAALRGLDGSAAQPTFSFTNEPSTGRFRDGPGQIVEAVAGVPVVRYLASGLEQWDQSLNGGAGDWVPLTPRDALGTPFDPDPSNLTSTNVQDAIEEVNAKSNNQVDADAVLYDDTLVYFPATTVQQAIDRLGQDVSGLANDILDNADAIDIIGGDLLLVEQRVAANESNIASNTGQIGLNITQINENIDDIAGNQGDISTIFSQQITQDSRIAGAEDWTQFNWGRIQTNEANISTNVNNINSNASRITTNEGELDTVADWFNNIGVLKVINGGTGVTSSTGTGSTVRSHQPVLTDAYLADGQLDTDVLAVTQGASNSSTRIATTAFVQAVVPDVAILSGSSSNGYWAAVRHGSSKWQVYQWGRKTFTSNTVQTYPVGLFSGASTSVTMTVRETGTGGSPSGPNIVSISATAFSASTQYDYECTWQIMGQANV